MEKIPVVLGAHGPLGLTPREDERVLYYTGRQREERTINGVNYIFYNPPAFLQQVGHQTYKEATGGLSIGYVPDPRDFVSDMPYISQTYVKRDPKRHIPPLICTGCGTLVVAGAAVWSLWDAGWRDEQYAKRLIPTKKHIQEALDKAQGFHWGQRHQQDKGSALDNMATDLVCRSISLTVQETDNTSVTDWVKKNIHLTGLKP